jgi:adenylate kinase
MWLVFVGPPGAGKGTQAEWLVRHLEIAHLSTGDMFREAVAKGTEIGKSAGRYLSEGKLVPDEIVIEIISQRLNAADCGSGALFDGFPRTVGQAQALDTLLTGRGTPLDLVLELAVDEQALVDRLSARGRSDDQPDVIRQRLAVYREQTSPVLEHYRRQEILHTIDGNGTIEEVTERLRTVVDPFQGT